MIDISNNQVLNFGGDSPLSLDNDLSSHYTIKLDKIFT